MHLQGEASKLKKFKTGLGRRFNDIVGDMQDIRDEGLHSLNELKVEYQVLYQVPGTQYQVPGQPNNALWFHFTYRYMSKGQSHLGL